MPHPADPTALHDTTALHSTLLSTRHTAPSQSLDHISHLQLMPTRSTYHHRSTRSLFNLTTCIKLHSNHHGWKQATFTAIPICHKRGSHPLVQRIAVNIGWQ